MEPLIIFSLLRLIVPLLIFRWPIAGVLASMYLDLQDFNYLDTSTPDKLANYQQWDKFMDTYYLAIAFITSLSWKETVAKKLSIFFFAWRFIGAVLILITSSRELLVFFPNIFENFFLFYLLFKKFAHNAKLLTSIPITILVISSIAIPKLAAEYYLHVLKSPQLFNIGDTIVTPFLPGSLEDYVLYVAYLGPTIAVLLSVIIYKRKSKDKAKTTTIR